MRRVMAAAALAALCCGGATAEPARAPRASAMERDVLAALNEVRANPRALADDLRAYREEFEGRLVHENGDPVGRWTNEGVRAVDEAIAFLDAQPSRPPLAGAGTLHLAAADLVALSGPAGTIGHIAGGRSPGQRVSAHGGEPYVGEVISYGQDSAAAVVRQLVVDDGEPRRGHRTLIFSDGYRFAGVSCGSHARWGVMCAVDLAATATGGPALPGSLASAR